MIEILDNNVEDDMGVLTTKTQDELVDLLVKARRQIHMSASSQVASGSGIPSGSGPVATLPPLTRAVSRLPPPTALPAALVVQPSTGRQAMGQVANSHYQIPPCIHEEGDNKQA
jgi:hypothetical protein